LFAVGFADGLADLGGDGEFVCSVAECHERAAEGFAVDCSFDLDEPAGAEDRRRVGQLHAGPGVAIANFAQRRDEGDVEGSRGGVQGLFLSDEEADECADDDELGCPVGEVDRSDSDRGALMDDGPEEEYCREGREGESKDRARTGAVPVRGDHEAGYQASC
jgi:hypothetical protein